VDTTTGRVSGFVATNGLTATTQAHVHTGARGVAGGVTIPLSGTAGSGVWVVPDGAAALTAAQIADFNAGSFYFNVHTSAFPDGEIRGQLDKAGTVRLASLDGAQEVPATGSAALGGGLLAVDATTGQVSGFVVTTGISGSAAHVHTGARGVPGGVTVPLAGGAGSSVWVVQDGATPLSPAQIADFNAGSFYFNVHTTAFPDGEIRGQIDKSGTARFASLDGAQEVPATGSAGVGGGVLAVDTTSGQVSGFAVTTGLSGTTQAHVHTAARGVAAGVTIPLGGGAGSSTWIVPDGAASLTAAQIADFTAGNLYYNVHTGAFTSGEIRGQIDRP
jgi:hypothetical protein